MRLFLIALLLVCFAASAEESLEKGKKNSGGPAAGQDTGTKPQANRGIQVFDDRVFDLGTQSSPPTTSKGGRNLDSEPDYNSQQRQEWIDKCSERGKESSKAFKECFSEQKNRTLGKVRERASEVEQKLAPPKTRSAPILDESRPAEPAFGGVEESN